MNLVNTDKIIMLLFVFTAIIMRYSPKLFVYSENKCLYINEPGDSNSDLS